ncbi:MAG: GntR family transcriptional regulator [Steroidobacteraceae bacterium]|jgi:DNA-binding GntR family transcriptional regulator|nr:GntR family transcriptional regulator [Steroidobacteraceae bacterium]
MSPPRLTMVRTSSLVELAHDQILEKITNGGYHDGDRIVIDDVAEQLGISRIPVREALARLHAEHLLEYERNKGYRVTPKADYAMLFQARMVIEPSAIRYCGNRVKAAQIAELRAINERISRLSTGKKFRQYVDFLQLNDRFHMAIVGLCGNRLITEAYKSLSYGPQFARHSHGRGIPDLVDNVAEHEAIVAALEKRDLSAAVVAAERHIEAGLRRFESYNAGRVAGGRG